MDNLIEFTSSSEFNNANRANVSILGATGTIGINTLNVIEKNQSKYSVLALTTNNNIHLLYKQCIKFKPELAVVADEKFANEFINQFKKNEYKPELLVGKEGLDVAASLPKVDYVMAAIVGAAGLHSTLAAARSGKRILLANKEAIVMSGNLLIKEVQKNNSQILPIDSEHNAVFQCLPNNSECEITKIILTASGGPFFNKPLDEFKSITPEEACEHPNWTMGKKISIDSATMMNKGLELIEACKLFGKDVKDVDVVVHPQSIIHSFVAYPDGSMLAHLAYPDMRVPIAHALAWPQRIESGVNMLDITKLGPLEFYMPDMIRFPCLQLAYEAIRAGGCAATILNAANEVAVENFLDKRIKFTDIPIVIDSVLQNILTEEANELEMILDKDKQSREYARDFIVNSLRVH